MDKTYADTVRLLLAVAPDVFANDIFAMKGGTAINLFVRDNPGKSVLIAAGVGFLLGLVARGRGGRYEED